MNANRLFSSASIFVALACLAPVLTQAQESGTLFSQTLTAQRASTNPTINFEVAAGKSAGSTTKLLVEIGPDGNSASPPPDPALPGTVVFRLSRTGGGSKDFSPAGGSDSATFPNKVAVLSKGLENVGDPRGLYVVAVAHLTAVAAAETWKLEVLNLPSALRVVASIDQGTFKSLVPVGATGSGGTACTGGQTCQPPGDHCSRVGDTCQPAPPFVKFCIPCLYERYIPIIFPPKPDPGPLCWAGCPGPWEQAARDGFERVVIGLQPLTADGNLLGAGHAGDIALRIDGATAVGPLFDVGDGQYMQMIEQPSGRPGRVKATIGGVSSDEVIASPRGRAGAGVGALAYVIGLIVALLAALLGYLLGTRRVARAG